ncbi:GPI transamidase component PIG-T [Chironomus tepperi]|uniref:GPI transamidase component PIG-T n=1 Tax=Chironomus tepperi TaxID=113505 RepID=UPI00391F8D51
MKKIEFLLIFAISLSLTNAKYHNNVFSEELVIKELNNNFVNTYFQFTTQWNFKTNENDLLHTDLLSRSISELFLHYDIIELHVTLSNGLWKHEFWGFPVESAGSGAELYVWFKNHLSEEEIKRQWIELSEALSGLLCASFSFVEETNTISPQYSYRPTSSWNMPLNSSFIRYAALPREVVCTENLTPWKKLLPCDPQEGFMSLLNAQYIYSTNFHSLGIHVRQLCVDKSCSNAILESKQTVNLVHDLKLFGGSEWSIRKLFGQGLNGACSVSSSSKIYLDITDKDFEISPRPQKIITSKKGGSEATYGEYDVKKWTGTGISKMVNIAVINKKNKAIPISSPPPLYAKRFLQGTGKERGKIVNQITNTHWSSLNLVVMENFPWFVPIYLHTLKLRVGNKEIKVTDIKYNPGEQRKRAYHLEVAFTIPAKSTVEMSIDFDYIFLRWQEYPPDANHGQYIPSSVISTMLPIALNYTSLPIEASLYAESFNATRSSYFLRIHTEALLINLPTPDFSMPYNVICLACTVVALAFGPLHNMTTKRLVLQKKEEAKKSFLARLKDKLFKKKEKPE